MNARLPYHILNVLMIAGGVCFILNMLNLVPYLMQFKIIHFLGMIGGAIFLKLVYGFINKKVQDPITAHPYSKSAFFLAMGVLATALVMRSYNIPYYRTLLYIDIFLQAAALGISFSVKVPDQPTANEEIIDL